MSNLEVRDYALQVQPATLDCLLEYETSQVGLRVPMGTLVDGTPCIMIDQPQVLRVAEGSLQLQVGAREVEIALQYEDTSCPIQAAHANLETQQMAHMLTQPVTSLQLYRSRRDQWHASLDKQLVDREDILNTFVDLVAGYGLRRFRGQ